MTIRPVPDTMALVSALLPVAQAVAVHAALTRAALSAKASGDQRGKGQVMADTLVELVTGQSRAEKVPVEVQVVITDKALVHGDPTPAHVPGYGPVPADWVRDLLSRLAETTGSSGRAGRTDDPDADADADAARVWLRRLFVHPSTGSLVAMESNRRLFPAALRRFVVARDGTCRTPWCDAPVAHADHVEPYAAGGPTTASNGQGLCVRCNLVKEQRGWRSAVLHPGPLARQDTGPPASAPPRSEEPPHTVRVTTPTGHSYVSVAPPVLPGAAPSAAPGLRRRVVTDGNGLWFEVFSRDDVEVELAEAC